MFVFILWIVIILSTLMNIILLIKIENDRRIFRIQDNLIHDMFEELMKDAKNLTIDDIADMEDFV